MHVFAFAFTLHETRIWAGYWFCGTHQILLYEFCVCFDLFFSEFCFLGWKSTLSIESNGTFTYHKQWGWAKMCQNNMLTLCDLNATHSFHWMHYHLRWRETFIFSTVTSIETINAWIAHQMASTFHIAKSKLRRKSIVDCKIFQLSPFAQCC